MIDNWPILSIITFMPLAGVLFLLIIRGDDDTVAHNSRNVALWVSAFTFLVSLVILIGFDSDTSGFQFEEQRVWLGDTGISYHMGVDGISMPFVLLSTFLTPLAILASWRSITNRVREYMIAFLVLETMMIGMFVSLDMLMFYLFFEAVLIPMFLIIGVWPCLMGLTMYLQQKLNPTPPDPIQAKIFMFFPLFLTIILAPFASGLVLYWTANNILTMAQQVVIMRRTTVRTVQKN